jgi:DNA-binding transcriptional LysR family regulator
MVLDLHDLEVFLAVERQGSFGRAATTLLVTQPAVSERIRQLERVIGRSVFERGRRGTTLTPAGEALLPYARRCITLADEIVEAARSADGVPRFTIAVHSTFAPRVVPFVLGALASAPRRIVVRDAHSEEIPVLLLDGVADVGFAVPAPSPPGLRRVALRADPVVCLAAGAHPITRLSRPTVTALRTTEIALNHWGDGADAFVTRAAHAGVEEWRIRRCGDPATAITLAREHAHVAFVARSAADRLGHGLRRVAFAGISAWNFRLDLVHRVGDHDEAAIHTLLGALATA